MPRWRPWQPRLVALKSSTMIPILFSLLLIAFAAATFLPGSSEVALIAVLTTMKTPPELAILVATIGNTLGSVVNWVIGRFFAHYQHHPRFPIPSEKFRQYTRWYRRWGVWSLLLSWMPIIGDPLTAIAGVARTPLAVFIPIVFIAKGIRYLVVAGVFNMMWL